MLIMLSSTRSITGCCDSSCSVPADSPVAGGGGPELLPTLPRARDALLPMARLPEVSVPRFCAAELALWLSGSGGTGASSAAWRGVRGVCGVGESMQWKDGRQLRFTMLNIDETARCLHHSVQGARDAQTEVQAIEVCTPVLGDATCTHQILGHGSSSVGIVGEEVLRRSGR